MGLRISVAVLHAKKSALQFQIYFHFYYCISFPTSMSTLNFLFPLHLLLSRSPTYIFEIKPLFPKVALAISSSGSSSNYFLPIS